MGAQVPAQGFKFPVDCIASSPKKKDAMAVAAMGKSRASNLALCDDVVVETYGEAGKSTSQAASTTTSTAIMTVGVAKLGLRKMLVICGLAMGGGVTIKRA